MVGLKEKWEAIKDDFVVKILGSFSNWAWEGFQVLWNNIHPCINTRTISSIGEKLDIKLKASKSWWIDWNSELGIMVYVPFNFGIVKTLWINVWRLLKIIYAGQIAATKKPARKIYFALLIRAFLKAPGTLPNHTARSCWVPISMEDGSLDQLLFCFLKPI